MAGEEDINEMPNAEENIDKPEEQGTGVYLNGGLITRGCLL